MVARGPILLQYIVPYGIDFEDDVRIWILEFCALLCTAETRPFVLIGAMDDAPLILVSVLSTENRDGPSTTERLRYCYGLFRSKGKNPCKARGDDPEHRRVGLHLTLDNASDFVAPDPDVFDGLVHIHVKKEPSTASALGPRHCFSRGDVNAWCLRFRADAVHQGCIELPAVDLRFRTAERHIRYGWHRPRQANCR
jgi:hypothetical protein